MSTKEKAKLNDHYVKLDNGALVVSRKFPDLIQPYEKEDVPDYLSQVDHSLAIDDKREYSKRIAKEEREMNLLVRRLKDEHKALIVVLQGRDASGKSGATERVIEALDYDMELFQAVHIGPPTEEDLAHPFLWRFSRYQRQPRFGQARVFDRSWNERVLVEPVMGFVGKEDLRKSYGQIRTYEWLRVSEGNILIKFWLDISKKEQEKRFEQRAKKKPWKVSDDDEKARRHWNDYTDVANEMFYRTGTDFAPWYIISSQDKRYSRVVLLEVINKILRENIKS